MQETVERCGMCVLADYETVLEGLRVKYRQDFEREVRAVSSVTSTTLTSSLPLQLPNVGDTLIPMKTLKSHMLPQLNDATFRFFLCHGSESSPSTTAAALC